jgi:hypothetical protein
VQPNLVTSFGHLIGTKFEMITHSPLVDTLVRALVPGVPSTSKRHAILNVEGRRLLRRRRSGMRTPGAILVYGGDNIQRKLRLLVSSRAGIKLNFRKCAAALQGTLHARRISFRAAGCWQ